MSRRASRPVWVAIAALLAACLGLIVTIDRLPSQESPRSDEISVLRAHDQATVVSPERRVGRSQITTVVAAGLAQAVGIAGLLAGLALATGLVSELPGRELRRRRHLGRSLRAPPLRAIALAPVR